MCIQRRYKQGDYSHLPISKKGFLKEGGFLKVLTAPERRPAGRCGQRRGAQPRQGYGGGDKAQAWGPTVDLPAGKDRRKRQKLGGQRERRNEREAKREENLSSSWMSHTVSEALLYSKQYFTVIGGFTPGLLL